MNKRELEQFKKSLLDQKLELETRIAEFEEKFSLTQRDASSDLSSQPTHIADIAAESEVREEEAYFISSSVDELRKVNKALEKVLSNEYGRCEKCGCEINIERLKALPYAELCMKCGEES
jgi:RNA polymerase-binding transcription factor DksA